MAKKTTGPRPTKARTKPATALVLAPAATGGQLARVADRDDASVFREDDVTVVVGQPYVMGDLSVVVDAVYYVSGGKADARNGRLGEADKIAWRDPATGYECIIMRDPRR